MSAELSYTNVGEELAAAFPEFRNEIANELARTPDAPLVPQHAVFMIVISPLILTALREDPEKARRLFEFVERMSSSTDELVQNIVTTVILDRVLGWGTKADLQRAEAVMGPSTRGLYDHLRDIGSFRPPSR